MESWDELPSDSDQCTPKKMCHAVSSSIGQSWGEQGRSRLESKVSPLCQKQEGQRCHPCKITSVFQAAAERTHLLSKGEL